MNTYCNRPVLFRSAVPYPRFDSRIASSGLGALFAAAALAETLAEVSDGIALDLFETKDSYHVRSELPGVKRDAIQLELEEDALALKVREGAEAGARERTRLVRLPGAVLADKVEAKLEDGVLTIRLPKRVETPASKISININ